MRWIILPLLILIASCGDMSQPDWQRTKWGNERDNAGPPEQGDDAMLQIAVLDVGQGDATVIIAPSGDAVLIDAGPCGMGKDTVIPFLKANGIASLSYIMATHYHEDHICGIPEVIAGADSILGTHDDIAPENGVYDRGGLPDSDDGSFESYISSIAVMRNAVEPGQIIMLGDVSIEAMAANGKMPDGTAVDIGDPPDENAMSMALVVEFNGFRMFIGGDITGGGYPGNEMPDVESAIADTVGDIDVLRVSHHGSAASTKESFLDATAPETAVISVGDDNDYSHPHEDTIDRLLERNMDIFQTERGSLERSGPVIANGHVIVRVGPDGSYDIVTRPRS